MELTINDVVSKVFLEEDKYANLIGMIKALDKIAGEANTTVNGGPGNKTAQIGQKEAAQLRDTLQQLKESIVAKTSGRGNSETYVLAEAALEELGKTMNLAKKDLFTKENIGRKLMQSSSRTVSGLKRSAEDFIRANKERYVA